MTTKILTVLKVSALAFMLSFGLSFVYAWIAPTATPPGGNVVAPINISSIDQTKQGDICTMKTGTKKCLSDTQVLPPTLSFSALPATIASGGSSTLTWSSSSTASCVASGSWTGSMALSGTQSTGALGGPLTNTYTITCVGVDGSSVIQTATVAVNAPAPTLTFSASPVSVANNGSATLIWSSTNATSCTASGSWTGVQAVSGTASTGALIGPATKTYTLACIGSGGTVSKSATVTVAAPVCVAGSQSWVTPSATPYSFTVPTGCTAITITTSGGGGGFGGWGYHDAMTPPTYYGKAGGSGATRSGVFTVTPGQPLNVYVGAGGGQGSYWCCGAVAYATGGVGYNTGINSDTVVPWTNTAYGGAGGGSSAVLSGASPLLVSPGGGGGGAPPSYVSGVCYTGTSGGAGGGIGSGAGGLGALGGGCLDGSTAGGNATAPIASNGGATYNVPGGNGSVVISW